MDWYGRMVTGPWGSNYWLWWFESPGLVGNGSGQNIDRESADDEESETGFGEHHDGECRKRERIRKAPGLKLERLENGAG